MNTKPGTYEAELLRQANQFDAQCQKAADAIAAADVVVLVTGAGWSADSGLPVFADVAKVIAYRKRGVQYDDIARPYLVGKDPELYFGFWGNMMNKYRCTKPHEGYNIVSRWRDDKNKANGGKIAGRIRDEVKKKVESQRPFDDEETQRMTPYEAKGTAGAFFAFTSNVDCHHYDHFEAHEVHDCHGNIELWQCSNRDCPSGIWRAPVDYKFEVDTETMLAPSKKNETENAPEGQGQHRTKFLQNFPAGNDKVGWMMDDLDNYPQCGHCAQINISSLARPAIFMFGDFGWKYDMSQSHRWDLWRESLVEMGSEVSLCVIEVGCGVNIATCRNTAEGLVEDLFENGGTAKLVRINPDFPLAFGETIAGNCIPIKSKGLRAIKRIDELYLERREGSQL